MHIHKFHLFTGSVISALILLVGHYFPWHKFLPEGKPLSRIWSYRYGSGACWAGFAYWRFVGAGDKAGPLGLMAIYVLSGLTTQAAYWLDKKGHKKTIANRRRKSAEIETLTKEDAYELFAQPQ